MENQKGSNSLFRPLIKHITFSEWINIQPGSFFIELIGLFFFSYWTTPLNYYLPRRLLFNYNVKTAHEVLLKDCVTV